MSCPLTRTRELLVETDKIVDDLYYLEDILCVEDSCLGKMVTQNLVSLLVFPMLLPLLQLGQSNVRYSSSEQYLLSPSCLSVSVSLSIIIEAFIGLVYIFCFFRHT